MLPAKTLDKVRFIKEGEEDQMAAEFDVTDLQKRYGGQKENIEAPFWPPKGAEGLDLVNKKYCAEKDIKEFYVLGPEEDGLFLSGDSDLLNASVINLSKLNNSRINTDGQSKALVAPKKVNFWDKFVGFMCCTGRNKASEDLQRKVIKDSLNHSTASQRSRLKREDLNASKNTTESKPGKSILKNTVAKKNVPNGVTTSVH
jgi:hypothetical protein